MNQRPRVLCTHRIPETGLNMLKKTMEVKILDVNLPIDSQLKKSLPTADFLVPLLSVNITEGLLNLAPSLRGIANYAVGYNNIDIAAAGD